MEPMSFSRRARLAFSTKPRSVRLEASWASMTASALAACAAASRSLYRAASEVTLDSMDLTTSRTAAKDAFLASLRASFIVDDYERRCRVERGVSCRCAPSAG